MLSKYGGDMQQKAVLAFRAQYRQAIAGYYRGWLHAGLVFGSGLMGIIFAVRQLHGVTPLTWLILPATLLFANVAEYIAHRYLGHHKSRILPLFYQRHTGDHHSFFDEELFYFENNRDLRVVFFPVYLIYAFIFLLICPVGFVLISLGFENAAALFAIGALSGYLLYELLHFSYHIPGNNPFRFIPWWCWLRDLHQYHHRHGAMQHVNFNITLPLVDVLLGTYKRR
jgi:hypothetical protein